MKVIKRIFLSIFVLLLLLIGISFLLPREVSVARSTVIAAPPEAIFPYLNDLKRFNEWSPWAARDPAMQQRYEGPESGVGQKVTWASEHPQVGSGSQEIIESVANQRLRTALDFGGEGTAIAEFDLQPEGSGTKVTWGFTSDLGYNPIARYMGLMFDRWIGADYEAGLASLKQLVEG